MAGMITRGAKNGTMAFATSYKPHPVGAPGRDREDWPIFVCRQGACLFDPVVRGSGDPASAVRELSAVTADSASGLVILPACRDADELLRQPPLGLRLSRDEAAKLIADTRGAAGAFAATDIGPIGQEKASNQDFALAATIRIPTARGAARVFQFAAVADGVTTRTLWPERSARLAVFAAWRVARAHAEANRGFSAAALELFRRALVREITAVLENDMALITAAGPHLLPGGWTPDAYHRFKDRRELWYNSTLLVALLGDEAGLVASCGDGGVVVRKSENGEAKSVVLVRSLDDLAVSGVVSLGADALQFRQARISMTPATHIEIVMSTDGVDRTLRRQAGRDDAEYDPYGPAFSSARSSASLHQAMTACLDGITDREVDNVSAAVLRWPQPPSRDVVRSRHGAPAQALNWRSPHTPATGLASVESTLSLPQTPWPALWIPRMRQAAQQTVASTTRVFQSRVAQRRVLLNELVAVTKRKAFLTCGTDDEICASFNKVIFLALAACYASREFTRAVSSQRSLERRLDAMFREVGSTMPSLMIVDIELSGSSAVASAFLDALESIGLCPAQLRGVTAAFEGL
jgi:hypothetical protein